MKTFGWLFIGAGTICNRVIKCFEYLENAKLTAVYSRTYSSAKKFADEHNAIAYKTFEEAILADNIDAVYIATPHNSHMEYTIKALKAGKPVLCEKPAAPCLSQVKEMVKTARDMDLYFMEGMWTRFNPVIRKVISWVEQNKIGKINHIEADFGITIKYDPKSRFYDLNYAGGSLLDLGIYPIAFTQMLLKQRPIEIKSIANKAISGVDVNCSILLKYPNDITASLFCAINISSQQRAIIYGTNGYIKLDTFWRAKSAILHINNQDPKEYIGNFEGEGDSFQFEYVQNEILSGKKECSLYDMNETLLISEIMDTIRMQNNIVYPFE